MSDSINPPIDTQPSASVPKTGQTKEILITFHVPAKDVRSPDTILSPENIWPCLYRIEIKNFIYPQSPFNDHYYVCAVPDPYDSRFPTYYLTPQGWELKCWQSTRPIHGYYKDRNSAEECLLRSLL